MPGLVHIVDDDASFLTAIERRLKQAGYEVADNLPPKASRAACYSTCGYPTWMVPGCRSD